MAAWERYGQQRLDFLVGVTLVHVGGVEGAEAMGATMAMDGSSVRLATGRPLQRLTSTWITGATINTILAAVKAKGTDGD